MLQTGGKKLAGKSKRQCKEACSKLSQVQEKLSQHLLTRPGPLELVQSNILPADADLKQAINGNYSCFIFSLFYVLFGLGGEEKGRRESLSLPLNFDNEYY